MQEKNPGWAVAKITTTIVGHNGTGWGQYDSMQRNIVSHGAIGTKHKIRPKKRVVPRPWPTSDVPATRDTITPKKRVLTQPWPTLVPPL